MEEVTDRVLQVVQTYGSKKYPGFRIALDVNFLDAGLTSFDIIKLLLALEEEFGVAFGEVDISPQNFATVNSVAQLLLRIRQNPTRK